MSSPALPVWGTVHKGWYIPGKEQSKEQSFSLHPWIYCSRKSGQRAGSSVHE